MFVYEYLRVSTKIATNVIRLYEVACSETEGEAKGNFVKPVFHEVGRVEKGHP